MAHICHLVEGNPLAIELAAAWTYTIPCVEIAREIARGLDILTSAVSNMPEKHRSMRAAFEHSWNMLRPDEQAVFRRLSIFRGGFLREAAEKTAGASLMTLAALVDKSLLRLNPNGRYDLHELLRQFSDEQLEAGQEKVSIQAAHAAYFAHFLHARVADIKGRRQADAIFEIAAEFENVRTAWHWAVDGCHPDTISDGRRVMVVLHHAQPRIRRKGIIPLC
jgi:predicted ATPase